MRRFAAILACLFALALARPAAADSSADVEHLHVQLVADRAVFLPGDMGGIGLYFKLENGWHVYWQNAGDSGEPPHIKWTLPKGITVGPMQFPPPTRLPLGPLMDFGYEKEVLFPMSASVDQTASRDTAVLHAKVDWLVCREVCIPGKADLDLNLLVSDQPVKDAIANSGADIYKRLAGNLPQPLPAIAKAVFQVTATGFRLAVETGQRESTAVFFPAEQSIIDNPTPQTPAPTAKGVVLELKKDPYLTANPEQLKGVIELASGRNYEIAAVAGTVAAPPPVALPFEFGSLMRISALAFLGGLLLNLMPCVFPVLFLKGLALVQSGHKDRHKIRAHGFVYTLGILVSFWILVGALLGLRAAGSTLGWGFQFQSPVFLALMAGLLFFLGLSLAGQFEIGLTLTGAGSSLAAKQGHAGSFFTGVLAVVVATPCTAPFMGAAVGYALAQPAAVTFAVFTALALGLAAPYVALTLQPAWTRWLPKPGAWMEVLRQAVSVPIFATVIWLAWVLAGGYGATALAALLALFLLLAIAGWFLGRWPAKRWSTIVALVLIVAAIALAVYERQLAAESAPSTSASTASAGWQPWSASEVQSAVASGRPVFVDFTAAWCLSCQVNERVALSKPEVMQAFAAHNVLLLKADWTREDPAITEFLTALGRSGVPVYALYAPSQSEPQLLPQVLTPGIVTDALAALPTTY